MACLGGGRKRVGCGGARRLSQNTGVELPKTNTFGVMRATAAAAEPAKTSLRGNMVRLGVSVSSVSLVVVRCNNVEQTRVEYCGKVHSESVGIVPKRGTPDLHRVSATVESA